MKEDNKNPHCFTPEKDTPYPLCTGDKERCKHCCLSANYVDAGWSED